MRWEENHFGSAIVHVHCKDAQASNGAGFFFLLFLPDSKGILLIFLGCFAVSCWRVGDRPLSCWCRWPLSISYLDQRTRQGCGASNKDDAVFYISRPENKTRPDRCNASWCACCFVHHEWFSLLYIHNWDHWGVHASSFQHLRYTQY